MKLNEHNVWEYYEPVKIGFLPDAHVLSDGTYDYEPLLAIARWFAEEKVDIVANIGDFSDMGSLSSYDKGTVAIEGARVQEDLDFTKAVLKKFDGELGSLSADKLLTLGNHEHRLFKYENQNPEVAGSFGDDPWGYKELGYKVYDYLDIVRINGVAFSHAFVNPWSYNGTIQTGAVETRMRNIGFPHVQGHQHGPLLHGKRFLGDGRPVSTLVIGCAHLHHPSYWTPGVEVYRGAAILNNVWEGSYDLDVMELDNIIKRYGDG